MLKKITLLALAAAAFAAFAAPSLASAKETFWTKNGTTIQQVESVHFEGAASFKSETLGGVQCSSKATAVVDLLPGGHNATVTEFTDTAPATDCKVTGFLGSVCGENSLTNVELLSHANGTGTAADGIVHITEVELLNEFGSCLTLVLTGGVSATLDSTTAATKATLSGSLDTGGFGNVEVSGVIPITSAQAGVYGIETVE